MTSDNDLAAVSRALNDRAEEYGKHLFPHAKLLDGKLVVGSILGEPGQSFKITISGEFAGRCHDFESGYDSDLLGATEESKGLTNIQAADYGRSWLGWEPFLKNGNHAPAPFDPLTCPWLPKGATEPRYGVACWSYPSATGGIDGWVVRFDSVNEDGTPRKDCIPLHLKNGKPCWWLWCESAHRPIYNAHLLVKRPDDPVLILEGEKTADAAGKLFKSHVCISWLGGCKTVTRAAWELVKGRDITCWPDADTAGRDAMEYLTSRFPGAKLVDSSRLPEGWDLADPPPPGVSIRGLLDGATDPMEGKTTETKLQTKAIMDLKVPDSNDGAELLKHRFLCRHGALLLVGPTGVGKSSFSLQAMFNWALERTFFGIEPTGPIKSLIIQAENDEGDMAEIRDGVLKGMNVNPEDRELLRVMAFTFQETQRTKTDFLSLVVRPLLEKLKPDLLWIDPMLAYLGGDSNNQGDVGSFLRNGLAPLLVEFNCAAVLVHHTNKPPTGRDKAEFKAGDFAYMGTGSAEWANWPRAGLAIRSTGSNSKFELVSGKRGGRIGWKDSEGNTLYHRSIAHAEDGSICWRLLDDEKPVDTPKGGRPTVRISSLNFHSFLSACPAGGEGLNEISRRLEQWLADEHRICLSWEACRKSKIPELVGCGKLAKGGKGFIPGPSR